MPAARCRRARRRGRRTNATMARVLKQCGGAQALAAAATEMRSTVEREPADIAARGAHATGVTNDAGFGRIVLRKPALGRASERSDLIAAVVFLTSDVSALMLDGGCGAA